MRVAVTDACIFIDLIEMDLITSFFQLDLELHTSIAVINELYPEQRQILEAYQTVRKLHVHNLIEVDFKEMKRIAFPRGLSQEDRSVIYLAKKLGYAMVISSDKLVRDFAGKLNLPYHGIFWVLDQLFSNEVIQKQMAIYIFHQMPNINSMYQAAGMKKEIEKTLPLFFGAVWNIYQPFSGKTNWQATKKLTHSSSHYSLLNYRYSQSFKLLFLTSLISFHFIRIPNIRILFCLFHLTHINIFPITPEVYHSV